MKKSILGTSIPMSLKGAFKAQKNSDILFSDDINSYFKNRYSNHIAFIEGDGGGEGNGEGGGEGSGENNIDFNDPRIQSYVSEQTTGLKNKNNELLGKLNTANTQLTGYGDITPEQYQQAQQVLNAIQGNEEAQMIKDGRFDEVISKRMEKANAQWEEERAGLQSQLDETTGSANKYKSMYEDKIIGDEIRSEAIKSGVLPEAYDDVLRRANDIFKLGEDGKLEARDKDGNLLKDSKGMLVTPDRFIEGLRDAAPYYWPSSQGAGAQGNNGRNNQSQSNGDLGKLQDVVGNGQFDLAEYRKMRGGDEKERYGRN